MRITGGIARGIPLSTGRSNHIRPATDRMREAVFSSLGVRIKDARILDLFAGTGSYGMEALSRGAACALFVEKHPQAIVVLQQNLSGVLKSLGNPREITARIIRRDVLRFESSMQFDCIFIDPPYELIRSSGADLLQKAKSLLQKDGVLIYEMPGDLTLPDAGMVFLKRIGKSGTNEPSVCILQKPG